MWGEFPELYLIFRVLRELLIIMYYKGRTEKFSEYGAQKTFQSLMFRKNIEVIFPEIKLFSQSLEQRYEIPYFLFIEPTTSFFRPKPT